MKKLKDNFSKLPLLEILYIHSSYRDIFYVCRIFLEMLCQLPLGYHWIHIFSLVSLHWMVGCINWCGSINLVISNETLKFSRNIYKSKIAIQHDAKVLQHETCVPVYYEFQAATMILSQAAPPWFHILLHHHHQSKISIFFTASKLFS